MHPPKNETLETKLLHMPLGADKMNRNVVIEMVRVTEAAAIAATQYQGRGDKIAVDGAAVEAMRDVLNSMDICATIVIGEGEKDEAPMLYEGEVVGSEKGRQYGPKLDIAVDPVDGTTIVAEGTENAISVIAISENGQFLKAPEAWYMEKLAMSAKFDISQFSLDMSTEQIIQEAAKQKGTKPEDIVVCVLKRPRHDELILNIKKAGARIKLIGDGDVAGAIATCSEKSGVDLLMGLGGSPEGVIAAAALKCLGGHILGRLHFNDEAAKEKARVMGVENPEKVYTTDEMAGGEVVFAATGITSGTMLEGIHNVPGGKMSHSVVMRSKTGTVRWIEAFHKDK
jgi:fructose-1,6-bisphosphatase II / sedoheptulose-1,7-bisphosphatase